MTAQLNDTGKIYANAFRETRELLGFSPANFARLLDTEIAFIQALEQGELPVKADDKLLKLILATVTARQQHDLLAPFLHRAVAHYQLPELIEDPAPFYKLFEPVVGHQLARFPWLDEDAAFRCRRLQLTDQPNGLLLWAEDPHVHRALVSALPSFALAHLDLIGQDTLLFVPAIYLFLKFDTTAPNNPIPALLADRFREHNEKLPIGLAVPYQPFTERIPSDQEAADSERRLFIFSPDPGSLCEILAR